MFFIEFLKNRKQIGAILPSSNFLKKKISSKINYKTSNIIVELGAGTGIFTEDIIKNIGSDSLLIVFELNFYFYTLLKKKYLSNKNVIILNENVENLNQILISLKIYKVDYIISGLPLLNFPENIRNKLFEDIKLFLNKKFILFQYTKLLEIDMKKFYTIINRDHVILNFPPAYVYVMK